MQPDLVISQVSTLREWAEQWEYDASSGAGEVSLLLRRAAKQAEAVIGIVDVSAKAPAVEETGDHVPHVEDDELRHG